MHRNPGLVVYALDFESGDQGLSVGCKCHVLFP